MDNSIVKDIESLVEKSMSVSVGDKTYSPVSMIPIRDKSQIKPLKISNLSGLIDFINNNIDELFTQKAFIVIEDYSTVRLFTPLNQDNKLRDELVCVDLTELDQFPFGRFIDSDDFIIKLKSMFVKSVDQEAVLHFVSKLTSKNSIELEDDGVSQTAMITKGLSGAVKEQKQVPSIVKLTPFRTFLEIKQPESTFLLRLKSDANKIPQVSLFQSDGGFWKTKAVVEIKVYFSSQTASIPIIA